MVYTDCEAQLGSCVVRIKPQCYITVISVCWLWNNLLSSSVRTVMGLLHTPQPFDVNPHTETVNTVNSSSLSNRTEDVVSETVWLLTSPGWLKYCTMYPCSSPFTCFWSSGCQDTKKDVALLARASISVGGWSGAVENTDVTKTGNGEWSFWCTLTLKCLS